MEEDGIEEREKPKKNKHSKEPLLQEVKMKQKAEIHQENLDKEKTKPIRKACKKHFLILKDRRHKHRSDQKKIK